jgi:PAS domain S-box-containing protein
MGNAAGPAREAGGGEAPCFAHLPIETGQPLDDDHTLAELVRSLADAVVIADPDGTIVFWNEATTRIFGWAADEAIGRSLDLIIPERLRARHWDGYRRVMETGHTEYGARLLEVPAVHRDGHTISIAFTVSLLGGPGAPRPAGIAAVIRDDSGRWRERREMSERLTALEQRLAASESRSGDADDHDLGS